MNLDSLTSKLQLVVFVSVLNMLATAALFAQASTDKASLQPSVGVAESMDRIYQLSPY